MSLFLSSASHCGSKRNLLLRHEILYSGSGHAARMLPLSIAMYFTIFTDVGTVSFSRLLFSLVKNFSPVPVLRLNAVPPGRGVFSIRSSVRKVFL